MAMDESDPGNIEEETMKMGAQCRRINADGRGGVSKWRRRMTLAGMKATKKALPGRHRRLAAERRRKWPRKKAYSGRKPVAKMSAIAGTGGRWRISK